MSIPETKLNELREAVESSKQLTDKRKRHILEVEKMAVRLGEIYAPEKLDILRAAALLHDITKEYPYDRQIEICLENGYVPRADELAAPKTLHAITAALIIPSSFSDYADDEVVSAVRWHTTGHKGMTLTEKLIFLADYIDGSRTYEDCVQLRQKFFEKEPEKMTEAERLCHLSDILIIAYEKTVASLLEERRPICPDTVDAYNELVCERNNKR
jgi:nicotinate-nucleotide adenylyltransferase